MAGATYAIANDAAAHAAGLAVSPHVQVAELENLLSLTGAGRPPLFLRRNMMHNSGSRGRHRSITPGQGPTHRLVVSLSLLDAGRGFQTPLPVVVVAAVRTHATDPSTGSDTVGYCPLVARAIALPALDASSQEEPEVQAETVSLPLSLTADALPQDISVLILHRVDDGWCEAMSAFISRHQAANENDRNESSFAPGSENTKEGRAARISCDIDHNAIFERFFPVNDPSRVTWCSTVHPTLPSIDTHRPIRNGRKFYRSVILTAPPGSISGTERQSASTSSYATHAETQNEHVLPFPSLIINSAAAPFGQRDSQRASSATKTLKSPEMLVMVNLERAPTRHSLPTRTPIAVKLCSADGRLCVSCAALPFARDGYVCPFKACNALCSGGLLALRRHLESSHPYYEFCFPGWKRALHARDAIGNLQVLVRVNEAYFDRHGYFLPRCTRRDGLDRNHPLHAAIIKPTFRLPFLYHCPKSLRHLRKSPYAAIPQDPEEVATEEEISRRSRSLANKNRAATGNPPPCGTIPAAMATALRLELAQAAPGEPESDAMQQTLGCPAACDRADAGAFAVSGDADAVAATNAMETDQNGRKRARSPRHIEALSLLTPSGQPKFYHSKTCVAMSKAELLEGKDSDDESDIDEWMRDCSERLFECKELCMEEREFMKAWNLHVHQNPIHADADTASACVNFARRHAKELASDASPFRRCFVAHLANLWRFRLLTPQQMNHALATAHNVGGLGATSQA